MDFVEVTKNLSEGSCWMVASSLLVCTAGSFENRAATILVEEASQSSVMKAC